MFITSGCLLLLACAIVQGLTIRVSRRVVVTVIVIISMAHVIAARRAGMPATATTAALSMFWLACGAIVLGHHRVASRLESLTALCDVDEATGCLNRRGFSTRLERATVQAMRTRAPIALLALDIDHFKQVNDRFGHLAGDAVLREISASIMGTVGERGVVARLGGEEFAVLLPDTDEEGAGVMAERILATLRELRLHSMPDDVRLTMSAGIAAERIHDARVADALRARSDEALYAAKRSGRDRALLWAPGVHSHATPVRSTAGIVRATPVSRRASLD